MKVADVLREKEAALVTARSDETLQAAANRLRKEKVGALVVLDDHEGILGIVTERNICRALGSFGVNAHRQSISTVMELRNTTCSPRDTIVDVAQAMLKRQLRHLVVEEKGAVVGIISIGDVLKVRLDETQLENRVLRDMTIALR